MRYTQSTYTEYIEEYFLVEAGFGTTAANQKPVMMSHIKNIMNSVGVESPNVGLLKMAPSALLAAIQQELSS